VTTPAFLDISAEPRPLEQLMRDGVMKQRLRAAGLPLLTSEEQDYDLCRAVLQRDTLTAANVQMLRVDAALLRCQAARS
jgi:hypothetical protein